MLFIIHNDTPRFEVFQKLNTELLYFLEHSIPEGQFSRSLLTKDSIGQACWENAKENNSRAKSDLTRDKFENLFNILQTLNIEQREQLYNICRDNQNLQHFFSFPSSTLLDFLSKNCFDALKNLTAHLYSKTKDIETIINSCNNININSHFANFREVNGNVCKACGMQELSPVRANTPDNQQWRSDYDHQLCKSKYPLFAVHPDNLIPLCNICNQDAKKAKDLFLSQDGNQRLAFYPYTESSNKYIDIRVDLLNDPEPQVIVTWTSQDQQIIEKLNTWCEIYEIKNLVEGYFRNLEHIIEDKISPESFEHMCAQIQEKAREPREQSLKREPWAFWNQKLFKCLAQLDLSSFWEKIKFTSEQGHQGGSYILEEN